MYVCSCNALTDVQMRRVIDEHGADRPAAVFAACNCRAQCGTCVPSVCALLGLKRRCGSNREAAGACAGASFTNLTHLETRHAA